MSNLFTLPRVQSEAGAKLYFYQTGTTTPQNTYQDIDLTTPHANPVVADADGYFDPIYLDPALPDYRMKLTTSADVQLDLQDDVPASQSAGRSLTLSDDTAEVILENPSAASGSRKWRVGLTSTTLYVQTLADDGSLQNSILALTRSGGAVTDIALTATYDDGFTHNSVPVRPLSAVKTANENLASNTTVGNDGDLVLSVKGGGHYEFEALIRFQGGAGGFKRSFGFSGTTGANGIRSCATAHVNGSGSTLAMADATTAVTYATITSGGEGDYERITGYAHFSNTGLFSLKWAQNSSNVANTTVMKGSWLKLRRLTSATS